MSLYDSIKFKVFVSEIDLGSRVEYMSDLLRCLRANLSQVESLNTPEVKISHDRVVFIPTRHDSEIVEENPFRPSLYDYDESSKYEIEEQFYLSHIEEIKEDLYAYVSETINSSSWYTDSYVSCLNIKDVSADILLKIQSPSHSSIDKKDGRQDENQVESFQDGDHLFNDSQDNSEFSIIYSDISDAEIDSGSDLVDIIEDETSYDVSQIDLPQTNNETTADESEPIETLCETFVAKINYPEEQDMSTSVVHNDLEPQSDVLSKKDTVDFNSALDSLISSGYVRDENDVAVFKSRVALFLFFSSSNFAVKYNISKNELFVIENLLTSFDSSSFKSVLRKAAHRLPIGKRIDISKVDVNTAKAILELMASEV